MQLAEPGESICTLGPSNSRSSTLAEPIASNLGYLSRSPNVHAISPHRSRCSVWSTLTPAPMARNSRRYPISAAFAGLQKHSSVGGPNDRHIGSGRAILGIERGRSRSRQAILPESQGSKSLDRKHRRIQHIAFAVPETLQLLPVVTGIVCSPSIAWVVKRVSRIRQGVSEYSDRPPSLINKAK